MSAVLTVLKDGKTLQSIPLQGEAALGRGEDCVIRLDDRAVSRLHAVFRPTAEGVRVERKSNFTPLVVNGAECTEALLRDGDVLSIGSYLIRLSVEKESLAVPEEKESAPQSMELAAVTVSDSAAASESVPGTESLLQSQAVLTTGESVAASLPFLSETTAQPLVTAQRDSPGEDPDVVDDNGQTKVLSNSRLVARLVFPGGTANKTQFVLQSAETIIGRGKQCDVVIYEKKASRKHAAIFHSGSKFILKDLSSGNGTFVNNIQIDEQELVGDETLRIGDLEFRLEILDEYYLEKEKDFLPADSGRVVMDAQGRADVNLPEQGVQLETLATLPQTEAEKSRSEPLASTEPFSQTQPLAPSTGSSEPTTPLIPGISGLENKKRGFYDKYIRNFKHLEPKQKVIVVLFIVILFWFLMDSEEDQKPKNISQKSIEKSDLAKKAGASPLPQASFALPPGKVGDAFAALSEEQKRDLEAWHNLAFDYYKNQEYDKCLFEIRKIFQLVPDYKDSKEIERYALEGKRKLEALDEERRKKEEETALREKIERMVTEVKEKLVSKKYDEAGELISQVLAHDPENAEVGKFRAEIRAVEDALRQQEELKRVQQEIREQWEAVFEEAMVAKKRGQFYTAIDQFARVAEGLRESNLNPKLRAKAISMIRVCKAELVSRREPLLKEAQEKEGAGEYTRAMELYRKASRVDSRHPAANLGMSRILSILHEKAKAAYTEGVLAESYSDFVFSKKKFQECLEIAPPEDIYYQRAQSKLSRYFKHFREEEAE